MRNSQHLALVALSATATMGLTAFLASGPAEAALLTGAVKSATGEIMGGVTVSAKAEGSTISTSAFTDDQGNYYFPQLPDGKYHVWAQALGYDYTDGNVDLAGTKHQNFTLKALTDFETKIRQAPGDVLLNALPDKTPDDARMKQLVRSECTGCHTPSFPLQNKFDQAGWTAVLKLMEVINVNGVPGSSVANAVVQHSEAQLAEYLARARGPGDSSLNIVYPARPSGEAARAYWQEYDIPIDPAANLPASFIQNDGSNWTLGTPSRLVPGYNNHDVVLDYNHNVWFTSSLANYSVTIGKVDAKTGEVKLFKLPGTSGTAAGSHGIIRDAQGIMWFNASGALARLDPATENIKVFTPPATMGTAGGSLDFDGLGKIWVSTNDGVLRFDPDTQMFQKFASVNYKDPAHAASGATTYGVAADKNGNGWWAQMAIDVIGQGVAKTGASKAITLDPLEDQVALTKPEDKAFYATTPLSYNTMLPWSQGPRRMGSDKDGNAVWVGDSFGSNLARIDINTGAVSYIDLPDGMQPYHVGFDSNHNVWTNVWSGDAVVRYNPTSQQWTRFDMPSRGTETRYVDIMSRDGLTQVVLPSYRVRKISVMTFRSQDDIDALKKQAGQITLN
jgi:streptogramin lyase